MEMSGHGQHSSTERQVIPKFASFRPKTDGLAQIPENEIRSRRHLRAGDSVSNPSASKVKRRKLSEKSLSPRPHGHPIDQEIAFPKTTEATAKHGNEAGKIYVVDKNGDQNNLSFGINHTYATPSYFRFGAGKVVGSSSGQKIDRAASGEKHVVLSYSHLRPSKKGNKRALLNATQDGSRGHKIKPKARDTFDIDPEADFVALQSIREAKVRRIDNNSSVGSTSDTDQENKHYRTIEGNATADVVPEDTNTLFDSDVSHPTSPKAAATQTAEYSVYKERMELSRKLDTDRTNSDAWLDLIQHQDRILETSMASNLVTLTSAERRSNAEIKVSMYDTALDSVRDPIGREALLLGRMEEGAKVWDDHRLSVEWQSLLRESPEYLPSWIKYLDYKQTASALFRYDEVQSIYTECLSLLKHTRMTPGLPVSKRERLYEIQMYVLLRMTLFMRESGFVEQAVAAWEALLEYEFFRPSHLCGAEHNEGGSLHKNTVSEFQEFWDSETPRIGEEGSEGWVNFGQGGKKCPPPKNEMADELQVGQNLWGSWVDCEYRHNLLARCPARIIDETIEDDPYRVILFSDVQNFLTDSPSTASKDITLCAFLAFCQLSPYSNEDHDGRRRLWWQDGYMRNETLTSSSSKFEASHIEMRESQAAGHGSTNSMSYPFKRSMADYQLSSSTLFASKGSWFSAFDGWHSRFAEDGEPVEKTWVLGSLKQLVSISAGGDSFAEYFLALELCLSPSTVKKTARGLLKRRPSSLLIYNAYALIEYRLGNTNKGDNALLTSLKMAKTLDESPQRDSVTLWRTWIWELLSAGRTKEALERIVRYGDENLLTNLPPSEFSPGLCAQPALLLRTEQALTATRDHMLSCGSLRHAAVAMDCLILFRYLKASLSLSAATSAFEFNSALLSSRCNSANASAIEDLHQSFARLLYYHTTRTHLVKPSDIRSPLAKSIFLFPHNTIFLSLYAWNEARFRIDDRVRSIVRDVILAGPRDGRSLSRNSVIPHFFAIDTEMNRGITFGSNLSTIRSTFERAIEHSSGAHCAGLWKLYFLFEHSRGTMEKAKSVFWRAVRACPWVKTLYMLAFEYLRTPGGLGDEDLKGIYEMMVEREVRIHISLEDVFDAS